MASTLLPHPTARVSSAASMLLLMAGRVDSYWTYKAFSEAFLEAQGGRQLISDHERSSLGLIQKALIRLFPFEPNFDLPDNIVPRHAL